MNANHWKPRVNHLTHLSQSLSLHGQKDSFFTHFWVICPCTDPVSLKWVKWFTRVFLYCVPLQEKCYLRIQFIPLFILIFAPLGSETLSNLKRWSKVSFQDRSTVQNIVYFMPFHVLKSTARHISRNLTIYLTWNSWIVFKYFKVTLVELD